MKFSLSVDAVLEKVVKMGFGGFCGAIGWNTEIVGFLTGESVIKLEAWGGGSDTFILGPKRGFSGEVLDWRIDLRGERPLGSDAGGLKMMSLFEARLDCEFSSEEIESMKS